MKKSPSYRFAFLFLVAMLIVTVNSNAQDTVAIDSSSVMPENETLPDEETLTEEAPYYPDTLKINYRSIMFDTVKAIAGDKGFYYKRYMDSLLRVSQDIKPKRSRRSDFFNPYNSIFGLVFWIIAIGLFGFLVYRLFLSNGSFFSRSRRNISSDVTVDTWENEDDPEWQLQQAIKNGNYRLAVRYLYLLSLKRLADKNYIEINNSKTNYEYVNEIRKQKFANEFASLTLQYEYVWYGEYPVDQRLFEHIQGGFNQFHKNYT